MTATAEQETRTVKKRRTHVGPTDGMKALNLCMQTLSCLTPAYRKWALGSLLNWPGPETQKELFNENGDSVAFTEDE